MYYSPTISKWSLAPVFCGDSPACGVAALTPKHTSYQPFPTLYVNGVVIYIDCGALERQVCIRYVYFYDTCVNVFLNTTILDNVMPQR